MLYFSAEPGPRPADEEPSTPKLQLPTPSATYFASFLQFGGWDLGCLWSREASASDRCGARSSDRADGREKPLPRTQQAVGSAFRRAIAPLFLIRTTTFHVRSSVKTESLVCGCAERCHVSQWRLGLRPEKCASGACPHNGRFGLGGSEAGAPSFGPNGSSGRWRRNGASADRDACGAFFELTPRACPHRATGRHGTATHPPARDK